MSDTTVVKNEVVCAGIMRRPNFAYTPNGKARLRFKLEMPMTMGSKQVTDSIWVVAWEEIADKAATYAEGSNIEVKGRITGPRSYDKELKDANGKPVLDKSGQPVKVREWIHELRASSIEPL